MSFEKFEKPPKFAMGHVVCTVAASTVLTAGEMTAGLSRHVAGDWGDVCAEDNAQNELALKDGLRLMSVYETRGGTKFWIITEWDRSATTVLLPEDY